MESNSTGWRAWSPIICALFVVLSLTGCRVGGGSGSSSYAGAGSSAGGSGSDFVAPSSPTVVHNPEPSTMILFAMGIAGVAGAALKKRKKNKV